MKTHCWMTTCHQDFAWHELALREFARDHAGRMPLQRRAPGVGPHEEHLGQWWRSLLALVRTKADRLEPERVARIKRLARLRTGAGRRPHAHATRCKTDLERAVLIVLFFYDHGRLPRISGVDIDPERRAGRTLNTLRSRERQVGIHRTRPIDENALRLLDEQAPDWRGPRAAEPARDTRAVRHTLETAAAA